MGRRWDSASYTEILASLGKDELQGAGSELCDFYTVLTVIFNKAAHDEGNQQKCHEPDPDSQQWTQSLFLLCVADALWAYPGHIPVQGAPRSAQRHPRQSNI